MKQLIRLCFLGACCLLLVGCVIDPNDNGYYSNQSGSGHQPYYPGPQHNPGYYSNHSSQGHTNHGGGYYSQ